MKIGIISDIHDHIWQLDAALEKLQVVDRLICLGDLCSPFIMIRLAEKYQRDIYVVFGNNDADLFRITSIANRYKERVHLYGEFGDFMIDGQRFAIHHFNNVAKEIAFSGNFDVVCFGHNHQQEITEIQVGEKKVCLINPGPIMGVKFDADPIAIPSSFAIYDTETRQAEIVEIT